MDGPLDVEDIISKLTLDEKISLLSGKDFWQTRDIPRLGIPTLRMTDGPNGARGQRFFNGTRSSCMPCGTALAASWDVDLIQRAGRLLGTESIAKGAHVSLGPTINMQRSPLGGRGFESYSEDPFLAGALATAMVQGVQSTGVAACLKHFVCNDQEHERQAVNCVLTERALREIYLMPFMIAQKCAKPLSYMTSYSRVNGPHVSESPKLMRDILRGEWGFDGYIVSDWFGTYSAAESVNAGLDLEMPGPPRMRGPNLVVSVGNRKVSEHTINDRIRNLLNLINRVSPLGFSVKDAPENAIDTPEIRQTLRELATSSVTLLKNKGHILPFDKSKSIAVIGPNAKIAAYSGGGSASLRPTYTTTPFQGICQYAPDTKFTLGANAYHQLPAISLMSRGENGEPGVTCKFFNEAPECDTRICRDTIHTDVSDMLLVDYKHADINPEIFYMDLVSTITPEESGEYLFGCSVRGTAKILVDGQLIVDNATTQRQGATFLGAGTLEERGSMHLESGKTYHVVLQFGSSLTQKVRKKGATAMRGGGVRLGCAKVVDPEAEIAKAVALAKECEQVVIVAGLSGEWEAEGFDRPTMDLPGHTDAMIRAVTAANPTTAVVIQSGTPVAMPWADEVPSLVHASYGGNEGGNAIGDVIFGVVNPSGKLPLTMPKRLADNPAFLNFGSENGRVLYGEDVYIGYRYYEKANVQPLFPFGHGLSYTTFELRDHAVVQADANIHVSVTVSNVGSTAGHAVVQAYVAQKAPLINRPPKELKAFRKVFVESGQDQTISLDMDLKYAASYWDEEAKKWILQKGDYDIVVGQSSDATTVAGTFTIATTTWWSGL